MDAIRDTARLKRHLAIICDGCMEQIIKEKRKYNQTKIYRDIEKTTNLQKTIVDIKNSPLSEQQEIEQEFKMQQARKSVVNLKEEIQRSEKYDSVDMLIDPLDFCPQKRISEYTIEKLIQIVKVIDTRFPKKRYYEIFVLRYMKKLNQSDIAREMKISQVELSKRFVELIKLARENT